MRIPSGRVSLCLVMFFCSAVFGAEPAFTPAGKEFSFDTGLLRGTFRSQGRSLGLTPMLDIASGAELAGPYGVFSPYRLLTSEARYGKGTWDWASEARRLADGAVEVRWSADERHPLDLLAVYRWKAPGTLDLEMQVTPHQDLPRFELFLAAYFKGLPVSSAYVQACSETGGKAGFLPATQEVAHWHMYPRDDAAVAIIQDGRWQRPPNPVEWKIRPRLASPLAMRRNESTGLTALVMGPAQECFAIAMPFGEDNHGSIYLSLFGRDLSRGKRAVTRARLVIGHAISEDQALALYKTFAEESR